MSRKFECAKCTGVDVYIRFRNKGDRLDDTRGKYACALEEGLRCYCRRCGWAWTEPIGPGVPVPPTPPAPTRMRIESVTDVELEQKIRELWRVRSRETVAAMLYHWLREPLSEKEPAPGDPDDVTGKPTPDPHFATLVANLEQCYVSQFSTTRTLRTRDVLLSHERKLRERVASLEDDRATLMKEGNSLAEFLGLGMYGHDAVRAKITGLRKRVELLEGITRDIRSVVTHNGMIRNLDIRDVAYIDSALSRAGV